MKLIIHAGFHKTGTSSVQHALAQYTGKAMTVISFGGENQSIPIINAFSRAPENNRINVHRGLTKDDIAKQKKEIRESLSAQLQGAYELAILSGEGISMLDNGELDALRQFIAPYVNEIQVLAYLRPVTSYMESTFQENVKAGVARFNPRGLVPHYKRRLQNLSTVFGRHSIKVRIFERELLAGQDIVEDFFRLTGKPYVGPKLNNRNLGISSEAVKVLYCFWKFGEGYGIGKEAIRKNHRLIQLLTGLAGEKFVLDSCVLEPVSDALREEKDWVQEHFNVDLSGKDFGGVAELSGSPIGVEADLYDVSERSLSWLSRQSGQKLDVSLTGEARALQVAQACEQLRQSF